MKMDVQINNICRSTHFHLRNIGTIWHVLTESAAAQLIHSLVTSRFDYCNSLLYGLPDTQLDRLQRIQNIACRIVCQVPKAVHITPYLEHQHWLPIKQRIVFKFCSLHIVHTVAWPQDTCVNWYVLRNRLDGRFTVMTSLNCKTQ